MGRKPIGDLAKKLSARAYEGNSPLYRWTRENYAELSASMKTYRPTWRAIADLAAEAGQLDKRNNPPSAEVMRKIYWRVQRDIEGPTPAKKQTPPPVAKPASQGPVTQPAKDFPTPEPEHVPGTEFPVKHAVFRKPAHPKPTEEK